MSRNAAVEALKVVVAGVWAWKAPPSRRLRLFADVPAKDRPCAFLHEGGDEAYTWQSGAIARRRIEVKVFVYIDARDPKTVGAALLNDIMDAFDAKLAPKAADAMLGRNTLAGTQYMARIAGRPIKVPGDLDGDGLLIVPIEIDLP